MHDRTDATSSSAEHARTTTKSDIITHYDIALATFEAWLQKCSLERVCSAPSCRTNRSQIASGHASNAACRWRITVKSLQRCCRALRRLYIATSNLTSQRATDRMHGCDRDFVSCINRRCTWLIHLLIIMYLNVNHLSHCAIIMR